MAIDRREFLKRTTMAVVGLGIGPGPLAWARTGSAAVGDRVVVLLNLYGGNDGLNTAIPLDQYDRYRQLRPKIGFERNEVLALEGESSVGLNPGMTTLRDLYADGHVAIINGVGAPKDTNGLFDHAAQQYVFQSCDTVRAATSVPPSGWLGRYLDSVTPGTVSPGIDMGGGRLALTGAVSSPLVINDIRQFQLDLSFDAARRATAYRTIMSHPNRESTVAEQNRLIRVEALAQSKIIIERTKDYVPAVTYPPDSWLAYQLQQSAALIIADLGVRVIAVYSGGYDTHSGQNSGSGPLGYHDLLLKDVSDSVAAFVADVDAHGVGERVLVVTQSEFGRRAHENTDEGTDHGFSSAAFAVGVPVKGGVYGAFPSLDESDLVFDGNTDTTTDFRSIYATVADRFFDSDPEPLVGGRFPVLGFL